MKDDQAPGADPVERLLRAAGPRAAAPADRERRVRDAVQAHWRRAVTTRRRARALAWVAVPLAAAAVLVAVLVPSGVWRDIGTALPAPIAVLERSQGEVRWPDRTPPATGASLGPGTVVETGAGGRVALRLRGGASVRFDAHSRARLLSEAELFLDRGALYVDTGAGRVAGTIVTIRTALGDVRDVGTQFQVRVSQDAIRLGVREGAARLEQRGRSHDAPSGTQLTLRGDGGIASDPMPAAGPEWDWIQDAAPPFDLEGRLLGEYLEWFRSETGLLIQYADPSILADTSTVFLHGSIEGLRPDQTLEAVLPTCGLRHRLDGASVIIDRVRPGAADND